MEKRYNLGKLKISDFEEDVFIVNDFIQGHPKITVLKLIDAEELLNKQHAELKEMKEIKRRNDSLTTRISKLRNENDSLKKHRFDHKMIADICSIIQERIDLVDHEPATQHVAGHMKSIKQKMISEGLWRD